MVISAVPKTQLTLSLSSSNLLISGHSAKAYSHSALDRLSRYRVRNKLTFQTYFHYFLYLNLRVGWWAIQILSIPNYSILQLSLASLSSYSQGACPSQSTRCRKPVNNVAPGTGTLLIPRFNPALITTTTWSTAGVRDPMAFLTLCAAQPG